MPSQTYVRIIRVSTLVSLESSPSNQEGNTKRRNQVCDGAWLEGILSPVRIGQPFRLRCLLLNGKIFRRLNESSIVVSVRGDLVTTRRVVYKILKVPPFDPDQSLRAWQ
jgi:hypothetical protein